MPIVIALYFAFVAIMFAGWVENVIWLFHQHTFVNVILGAVGAVVAPIGALHGLYLFF